MLDQNNNILQVTGNTISKILCSGKDMIGGAIEF